MGLTSEICNSLLQQSKLMQQQHASYDADLADRKLRQDIEDERYRQEREQYRQEREKYREQQQIQFQQLMAVVGNILAKS